MNRQLRQLGAGLLLCFLALLAMVSWVQVFDAASLNGNTLNSRKIVRDFDQPRGQIVSADGAVLARSVAAPKADGFERQRQYPEGDLFGHLTGYLNLNFGATGVESAYNDDLSGNPAAQDVKTLRDLFVSDPTPDDIRLTVRKDLQAQARTLLGNRKGSVVALDPRDGSILALWSYPSFDPNALVTHDAPKAQTAKDALEADPAHPLRARTWQERFFPGSTFKVVTGAIGVDSGKVTTASPAYPVSRGYKIDFTTQLLGNFGGGACGGTLLDILRFSCNSAFAEMGDKTLGASIMVSGAERFGFNQDSPLDLPGAARSVFPTDFPANQGNGPLARAALGQGDVQATPLEMAMIAGALGSGGVMMTPHVLGQVLDQKGDVVRTYTPRSWRTVVGADAAATMRTAMLGVVNTGTGTAARIAGVEVGGKTGTAQLGTTPPRSHAWFICFAGPPGQPPTVAVAVIVEGEPGASEQTGGRVAAPIAREMVRAALAVQK